MKYEGCTKDVPRMYEGCTKDGTSQGLFWGIGKGFEK